MTRIAWSAVVLLAVWLTGNATAQAPAANGSVSVKMTPDVQSRMGVEVTTLETDEISEVVPAYVRAVDIGPLIALDAEIQSARASAAMSSAEYKRLDILAGQDQSASQQAVETARAAAAADRSRVQLLERRLQYEWSPAFANKIGDSRELKLGDLVSGSARLVRADAPTRPEGVVGTVSIEVSRDRPAITASPLGLSAAVDTRTQTVGLFALVQGDEAEIVRPGKVFAGSISLPGVSTGVVIPRSGLLRVDGEAWVYVRVSSDAFVRRVVTGARPVADGWFVETGIAPGDAIATAGVQSLFAIEGADETAEAD